MWYARLHFDLHDQRRDSRPASYRFWALCVLDLHVRPDAETPAGEEAKGERSSDSLRRSETVDERVQNAVEHDVTRRVLMMPRRSIAVVLLYMQVAIDADRTGCRLQQHEQSVNEKRDEDTSPALFVMVTNTSWNEFA